MSKIALITGANKGIGQAAAQELARRGYTVLIGARDAERGKTAAQEIRADGGNAHFVSIDVADESSIKDAAQHVEREFGALDVLVNNAAINLGADSLLELSADNFDRTLQTNVRGPFLVARTFWPLLLKSDSPRLVNVSSSLGRLYDMKHDMPAYSVSKTALNALTRQFAGLGDGKVAVNSICPGWVCTDLGGENAPRTPEQGAAIIVYLATTDNPPNGKYLNDDGEIGW